MFKVTYFIVQFPIPGSIWSSIWSLVFYAFLETIPVEMILLHNIQSLFGEKMTYYTANYGFMSKISSNEDRPYRWYNYMYIFFKL